MMAESQSKNIVQAPPKSLDWNDGVIGQLSEASIQGRLKQFIANEESEPVVLFSADSKAHSLHGDWYGEHVGKWLCASCQVLRRKGDHDLEAAVRAVAHFLIASQEENGYLGTYAPNAKNRMAHAEVESVRSWDPWVHAWGIKGLLSAHEIGVTDALGSATRAGGHVLDLYHAEPARLLKVGNHAGLSSLVILEPLALLSLQTGEARFIEFAVKLLESAEALGLKLLSGPGQDQDIATIGTGKAYQLCWILTGIATMARVLGSQSLRQTAEYWWQNIRGHHLNPLGGPWGGIATHKEVFNHKGFFSPEGLVETCSIAAWMSLSRELYLQTGNDRYLAEIERSLYNGLCGAMDSNGADWCYFTFPNGRRNNTYYWACCKSSGALALEEVSQIAICESDAGVHINLLEPVESATRLGTLSMDTSYSDSLVLTIQIQASESGRGTIHVRIPEWATLDSVPDDAAITDDARLTISRDWASEPTAIIRFAVQPKVHTFTYSLDHHGQEIVRSDYAHISYGPFVYSTGLVDGYKKEETFRLAQLLPTSSFSLDRSKVPHRIQYHRPGQLPIEFLPYYLAGGRHDGAWRTTWLKVAWQ